MGEPSIRAGASVDVVRDFSVCRLEKQLLVKVYELLVPVDPVSCRLSRGAADTGRPGRPIGSIPRSKGARS